MMRRLAIALVLAVAGGQFASAGWIHAKAALGQWLLERAWTHRLETGTTVAPWPDAVSHPVARLRVPRLGIERLVLAGLDTPVMAWGPGSLLGREGHRIIAGHRDTHFAFLEKLRPGDRVGLQLPDGPMRAWRIRSIRVVDSRATALDLGAEGPLLTLVTCYPFDAATAGGPKRYVVQLRPLDDAAGGART